MAHIIAYSGLYGHELSICVGVIQQRPGDTSKGSRILKDVSSRPNVRQDSTNFKLDFEVVQIKSEVALIIF